MTTVEKRQNWKGQAKEEELRAYFTVSIRDDIRVVFAGK